MSDHEQVIQRLDRIIALLEGLQPAPAAANHVTVNSASDPSKVAEDVRHAFMRSIKANGGSVSDYFGGK